MTDLYRIIPHRLHVSEKWRALIEEEVERLVRILDRIDGDPDLEPEGDEEPDPDAEPSQGWTAREAATGRYIYSGGAGPFTDSESSLGSLECINQRRWSLGRNDDAEPSLGSLHCVGTCKGYAEVGFDAPHAWDQTRWALGRSDDREGDEHDGREPDTDGEAEHSDLHGGSIIAGTQTPVA